VGTPPLIQSDFLTWLAPIIISPFIGSFLGVLIDRLPDRRPVAIARSICEHCGHRLGVRDLIPLVSYLASRGRCRFCGGRIGSFAIVIELAATAVAVWSMIVVDSDLLWWTCLLGWALLTLAWIDIRVMILPDLLTLPLLLAGLLATAIVDSASLFDHALAAAAGYIGLMGVAWLYRLARGRDGLGLGDAKLLAAIGAWIGLNALPWALLIAASAGLVAVGIAMLFGKRFNALTPVPFGPLLALSGWLLWLYADRFDDWLAALRPM
jgi:leader peptidase (prepilin peptidase) / N-methyltransferase